MISCYGISFFESLQPAKVLEWGVLGEEGSPPHIIHTSCHHFPRLSVDLSLDRLKPRNSNLRPNHSARFMEAFPGTTVTFVLGTMRHMGNWGIIILASAKSWSAV